MLIDTYVTLQDAKEHLAIDEGLTIHDSRIMLCIGAAEDYAENYTQRSLAELMLLDSPADADQTAAPEPDPLTVRWNQNFPRPDWIDTPIHLWDATQWHFYWQCNPLPTADTAHGNAKPLRRDVYSAIMLKMETLFDRNTDNSKMLADTCDTMLTPYRLRMGV